MKIKQILTDWEKFILQNHETFINKEKTSD